MARAILLPNELGLPLSVAISGGRAERVALGTTAAHRCGKSRTPRRCQSASYRPRGPLGWRSPERCASKSRTCPSPRRPHAGKRRRWSYGESRRSLRPALPWLGLQKRPRSGVRVPPGRRAGRRLAPECIEHLLGKAVVIGHHRSRTPGSSQPQLLTWGRLAFGPKSLAFLANAMRNRSFRCAPSRLGLVEEVQVVGMHSRRNPSSVDGTQEYA